jgi:NTP pyrophosphatase (non-canonical NTP hydrolase)
MPEFTERPNLAELQKYVLDMKTERGFNLTDTVYECLLLGEEVGELFKAVRKTQAKSMIDEEKSEFGDVAEELADVLIFTLSLANMHGVDLEQALRDKEAINKKRTWKKVS